MLPSKPLMSSYYATASAYAPPISFGKKADAVTQTSRITHDYNLHGIGRLRDKSLPMHIFGNSRHRQERYGLI